MATDGADDFVKYRYQPSKAGALAVCIIFVVLLGLFILMIITSAMKFDRKSGRRDRKIKNCTIMRFLPFLVGITAEVVGYALRYISAKDTDKMMPYILQSVLLLVAPAFYAATIYMIFGQLLHYLECPDISIVPARWSTTIFVAGDVVSFFVQAGGAAIMSNADTSSGSKTGSNVIVAGLFVQVAIFGFFMITEIRFLLQVRRKSKIVKLFTLQWRRLNLILLGTSLLILIRSVVRAIEFIQGNSGYIISHEYFLYVFDALMMILATLAWVVTFKYGDIFMIIHEAKTVAAFEIHSVDDKSFIEADVCDLK
ncbi:unnamed protein product [Kluyveromyces dobzhanskii CBS 2104]|uniref:WGS project CCBQ000000000 data, contig 00214 n=1 Tax=Kluyveromyces dobzhanskii CBS 2104 TaxID=1427455 RepID=A0A0A8LCH3_9SACH|nr:unnamed protein product [Kluyveromyces dobzhanskii CBS 2104]